MKINTIFRRIIVSLLALSSIGLYACGNTGVDNDGKTDDTEAIRTASVKLMDENDTSYLPEYNLAGRDFKMLAWGYTDAGLEFFYSEAENSEVVNDAIYKRNKVIEERFNFNFNVVIADNERYVTRMTNSINSNDKEFDVFSMHPAQNAQIAVNGNMLISWNKINSIDLDKPWWNQSIRELIDINGYLPVISSDFLYSSMIFSTALIYNKNIMRDRNIESIYKLVDSGKWTIDNFYNMVKPLTMDITGDGIFDDNDQYGYSANITTHLYPMSYGAGILTVVPQDDGKPKLSFYSEKSVSLLEKMYDLYLGDKIAYQCKHDTVCPIAWDADRVFIQAIWLHELPFYRNSSSDFGIIPYPKWDEKQEDYYTFVDGRGQVLGIPSYVEDPEMVGSVVEAFSAESRKTVIPAYYDLALNTKYVRDEDSSRMLNIIFDGRVHDFGYIFRNPTDRITSYLETCIAAKNKDLTSYYDSKKDMWQTYFNGVYEICLERSQGK